MADEFGNYGRFASGRWGIIGVRQTYYPDDASAVAVLASYNHFAESPPGAGEVWDQPGLTWDGGAVWGVGADAVWNAFRWNDGSVWDDAVDAGYPYAMPLAGMLPRCARFQAYELEIINRTGETLLIYPPPGGQIEDWGTDVAMAIDVGQTVRCFAFGGPQDPRDGAQWFVDSTTGVRAYPWLQDDLGGFMTTDLRQRIPLT